MCPTWRARRSSSRLRASPRTVHHSGTMLIATPPSMTPTLAVVISSMRPRLMSAIARPAAAIALRPSSGAMPACAATPWNSATRLFCEGAAVITSPSGPLESNTKPARACAAPRSNALAPRRPTSSHVEKTTSTRPGGGIAGEVAQQEQHDGAGTLVVGAQDRVALAAHDPAVDDGSDGALDGDGVEVGADEYRHALPTPLDDHVDVAAAGARLGGAVVFDGGEPAAAHVSEHQVGDGALVPGGRRSLGKAQEEVEQLTHGPSFTRPLGRLSHRLGRNTGAARGRAGRAHDCLKLSSSSPSRCSW